MVTAAPVGFTVLYECAAERANKPFAQALVIRAALVSRAKENIVTKKVIVVLLVLVLTGAVGVVVISAQGGTQHVDMTLTGTVINIGDGVGLFDVDLRGSPGQANASGLSFSYPVEYSGLPPGNPCVDLGAGPSGFIITNEGQLNMIFNDGSMLFANAAEGGYVCFVPSVAYAPYVFAGGTGRYEGATGYINFDISAHPFGPPGSPVIPETGTASGEIVSP
jgi:hypothetical protein